MKILVLLIHGIPGLPLLLRKQVQSGIQLYSQTGHIESLPTPGNETRFREIHPQVSETKRDSRKPRTRYPLLKLDED